MSDTMVESQIEEIPPFTNKSVHTYVHKYINVSIWFVVGFALIVLVGWLYIRHLVKIRVTNVRVEAAFSYCSMASKMLTDSLTHHEWDRNSGVIPAESLKMCQYLTASVPFSENYHAVLEVFDRRGRSWITPRFSDEGIVDVNVQEDLMQVEAPHAEDKEDKTLHVLDKTDGRRLRRKIIRQMFSQNTESVKLPHTRWEGTTRIEQIVCATRFYESQCVVAIAVDVT